MRVQPRQQTLELWNSLVTASYRDNKWQWGGRAESDSITDAQQLLCLMLPPAQISTLQFTVPDETEEDVLQALRGLGDAVEIPRVIARVLREHFERYSDTDGAPLFHGTANLSPLSGTELTGTQRMMDLVESYSLSVTLCLAVLGFTRDFRTVVRREDLIAELTELEAMASRRLTGAMTGLLRSFAVNAFESDSPEGMALIDVVNQGNLSHRRVVAELRRELADVLAGLANVRLGSGGVPELDSPSKLFELGWSWGVVTGAVPIEFTGTADVQRDGIASDEPYLYFTSVAMDGIADLFSARTRRLALLNDDQQRLAQALQSRWELTQRYWATLASFGGARWPLEDIPWRTSDNAESDYFSLLVASITTRDLEQGRALNVDLDRLGRVLSELANRARITRRPSLRDSVLTLHSPGVRITLVGSDDEGNGPGLAFDAPDFGALLLKRIVFAIELVTDVELRSDLIDLMDLVWDHMSLRRLAEGPTGALWDQPKNALPQITASHDRPSWNITLRMVEALTRAGVVAAGGPLASRNLTTLAEDLLSEAWHMYDRELLSGGVEAGPAMRKVLSTVRAGLVRAGQILPQRPGSAFVLTSDVIRELDQLDAARQDSSWIS